MDIPKDDLINCWLAEGFLGEHDTYEEAHSRRITTVQSLKDACLLETLSLKMHDVAREIALRMADPSVFLAGGGLTDRLYASALASVKRVSLASNRIECLPDWFTKFREKIVCL